jgi:hypothetical protein
MNTNLKVRNKSVFLTSLMTERETFYFRYAISDNGCQRVVYYIIIVWCSKSYKCILNEICMNCYGIMNYQHENE